MLKMALLDRAINKKCCSVDEGRGISPLFSSPIGGFDSSRVPTPGNLPSKAKKMLMPRGQPGEGAGRSWNCRIFLISSKRQTSPFLYNVWFKGLRFTWFTIITVKASNASDYRRFVGVQYTVFFTKAKEKILHLAHQLLWTLYWRFFFFTRNYWQPQTGKHHHISGCFSDGDQSLLSFTLACNCFQSWEVCANSGIPVQMYPSP